MSDPRAGPRTVGLVPAFLVDVALYVALSHAGWSSSAAHLTSFAAGALPNHLLQARAVRAATPGLAAWRRQCRLLSGLLLALLLRAGVLGEAASHWGWPPLIAIALAAGVGWGVVAVAWGAVCAPRLDLGRLATLLTLYAFALRSVYGALIEPMPEETYYWNYAQHLDYGYLDHPPMVAWLIRLGTNLFGNTAFGIRLGALASAVVAAAFAYRTSLNLFGVAAGRCALILTQALPFFFLSGFVMTPDAPLTAAWAACLYFLERALMAGRARAWWGVGAALGVGMLSKYSIGLLVPVIAALMILDRPSRRWWRQPEPYAAALLAALIFMPVILWNAHHDWASFAFQTSRRLAEAPRFALHKLIASTLVLITPVGVAAVAVALWRTPSPARERDASPAPPPTPAPAHPDARRWLFLRVAMLLPLAVFTLFSLRHEVKLDWTGAPWVAALPVMAVTFLLGRPRQRLEPGLPDRYAGVGEPTGSGNGAANRIGALWMPTVLVMLIAFGALFHYLALGFPRLPYAKHIELLPVGWDDLGLQIDEVSAKLRDETGAEPVVVGMDRYAIASELEFHAVARGRGAIAPASVNLFGGIGLMYERWSPAATHDGATLLLVALDPRDLEEPGIAGHVERLGSVTSGTLSRDGRPVRPYYYRVAYNYHSDASP